MIGELTDKIEVVITIDEYLWNLAKDKLNMSRSEFIEYALRLYLREDSNVSRVFKKGINLQVELDKVTNRLYALENKNKTKYNEKEYLEAMETVYRINDVLGYVGKNQLKKIANQREFNVNQWLRFVEKQEGIVIKNYGELPK